jgi:signal transduction histidine kinase
LKNDEFFIARLKLTFFYSLTALVILAASSLILYNVLLINITESIGDDGIDRNITHIVLHRTEDSLANRFIVTDSAVMFFVVIAGFLLTKKTLDPIRKNMQKQKRFIADASHEFRTPITIAISGLEVALRSKDINLGIAKDTLAKTLIELQDLSKLTNDMLNITKSDVNVKKEYEIVKINEVVSGVAQKIAPIASEKGLEIKNNIKFKASVLGSRLELERVIYNILNNSIAHTPKGGSITIFDICSKKDYKISVSDTGIGISKENIDRIFDPFFQGDISRNTGGAGLGLTLAKQIVENHNGIISIKSELHQGTTVTVTLPISSR